MAEEKKAKEAPKAKETPKADEAAEKAKQKKKRPEFKEQKEVKVEVADGIKNRVRVSGVILDGSLEIKRALRGIKGIGPNVARILPRILGIPGKEKLGNLSEQQIQVIESTIQGLDKHLPVWMINRQGDYESGRNAHLIGPDLDMAKREDINLMKRNKSYKGVRHSINQPVRGQRTRSSFRKGGTVGVSRKKATTKTNKETKTSK